MKSSLLPLALLFCTQAFAQNLTEVPYYFALTEEAHMPLKDKNWKKISIKGVDSQKAYLRGYTAIDPHVLNKNAEGSASTKLSNPKVVASKRAFRRGVMKELLAKQIIQTGDVVLSFRPNWESTIPYAHIQMGVSHASLAYVDNGVVKNLDMPLDAEYNGENLSSGFDSNHFIETDHLQILRPRNFGGPEKANLKAWIAELKKNYATIRSKSLLKFNPDYSAAKIDKYSKGDSFVTKLARIMKGTDTTSTDLTMFCSEYVWSMLSLASCIPSDAQFDDPSVTKADCVKPIFTPMHMTANGNNPGLTEGPLTVLKELDISPVQKMELTKQLFTQGKVEGLSSGHRALAANQGVIQLVGALQSIYGAKLNGQDKAVLGATQAINAKGGRNYSPTSFLINAMIDQQNPERKFDYVATLIFAPKL